jgi:hypothetical protein
MSAEVQSIDTMSSPFDAAATTAPAQGIPLAESTHWPSLATPPTTKALLGSPLPSDTSWEMVPPSSPLEIMESPLEEEEDAVMIISRPVKTPLIRQRSSSTPDLFGLKRSASRAEEEEKNDVFLMSLDDSSLPVKSIPSFRDKLLAKMSNSLAEEVAPAANQNKPKQPKRKPKFVVTPTLRCSVSTPNFRNMDDEVLGETDASEYYNRKAMGYAGRQNGMKIRPDEAKRRDFTLAKKEMQRESQARK